MASPSVPLSEPVRANAPFNGRNAFTWKKQDDEFALSTKTLTFWDSALSHCKDDWHKVVFGNKDSTHKVCFRMISTNFNVIHVITYTF